jgi:Flp pilus assembly protein TadD
MPPARRATARTARVQILVLLLLAALPLSPVLFAEFIRLDDYAHILENPELRKLSVAGLSTFWTKPYFGLYVPLTYSVWCALSKLGSLFGELEQQAWLFHACNLALHLVNVALVFGILRLLLRVGRQGTTPVGRRLDDQIAFLAALFFALHPTQVESVAWVSELKGELAALCGLAGIWWHCRSGRRLLVLAFLVAAMLAKPTAIVFLGIVFLIDRILLRKSVRESAVTPLLASVPILILAFVTKRVQPESDQSFIPTLVQRPIIAADALGFYLSKLVIPFPLALDYGRAPRLVLEGASRFWLACSLLSAAAGVALVGKAIVRPVSPTEAQRWPALLYCGWAIFMVSLVPVLGLIPFEFQYVSTVADRYLYVPLFGVSLMVAGILVRLAGFGDLRRMAALPLVMVAGIAFAQARMWRSTESLFTNTAEVSPNSYLGPFCLGEELLRLGRLDEAIGWLQASLAINPDYVGAVLNLGTAYSRRGESEKAIATYRKALAKNPSIVGSRARSVASLHNNLGLKLVQSGQEALGVEHLRKAVAIFPGALSAHVNLGNFALQNQRYGEAIAAYETALTLSPGNAKIEQRLEYARQHARER